jgi:UDP-galactopyranose mutase
MDFTWIDRRVPTPDVERIIAGAVTDDVAQVGVTAHFWYPVHGGIESLPKALGERVNNVHLGKELERIDLAARELAFTDGDHVPFDRMIYTLPLARISDLIPDLPPKVRDACDDLRYQGVYCLNLGIDRPDISDKHWVYFYEDGFPFHRLSFPANFTPHNVPPGKSSIAMEIAFSARRPLDRDRALDDAVQALRMSGILRPDDRIELVHGEEIVPAYVIYHLGHAASLDIIRSWLAEHEIVLAGRFGEWQYFNMDHAMSSGRDAARALVARAGGARRSRIARGA